MSIAVGGERGPLSVNLGEISTQERREEASKRQECWYCFWSFDCCLKWDEKSGNVKSPKHVKMFGRFSGVGHDKALAVGIAGEDANVSGYPA